MVLFLRVILFVSYLGLLASAVSDGPRSYIEEHLRNSDDDWLFPTLSLEDCPGIEQELVVACASVQHSCYGQCGEHSSVRIDALKSCSCDDYCGFFKDCCADFSQFCPHLVNESARLKEELKVEAECIDGYAIITSCPTEWYVSNYRGRNSFRVITYNYVSDMVSGLAFKNWYYFQCNGKPSKQMSTWPHDGDYHYNESARICYTNSLLTCSSEFKSRSPGCAFAHIQIGMHSTCPLFSSNLTRQFFVDFMARERLNYKHIPQFDTTLDNINMPNTSFREIATLYHNSCYLSTEPFLYHKQKKNTLSKLFSLSGLGVHNVASAPTQFLTWCAPDQYQEGCIKTCQRTQLLESNVCHDIDFVELKVGTSIRSNFCQRIYTQYEFVFDVLKYIPFLEYFSARDDTSKNITSVTFGVNKELASSRMKDPFLRSNLHAVQKGQLFSPPMQTKRRIITVCVKGLHVYRCKLVTLFVESEQTELYSREGVHWGRKKRRKKRSTHARTSPDDFNCTTIVSGNSSVPNNSSVANNSSHYDNVVKSRGDFKCTTNFSGNSSVPDNSFVPNNSSQYDEVVNKSLGDFNHTIVSGDSYDDALNSTSADEVSTSTKPPWTCKEVQMKSKMFIAGSPCVPIQYFPAILVNEIMTTSERFEISMDKFLKRYMVEECGNNSLSSLIRDPPRSSENTDAEKNSHGGAGTRTNNNPGLPHQNSKRLMESFGFSISMNRTESGGNLTGSSNRAIRMFVCSHGSLSVLMTMIITLVLCLRNDASFW